MNLFNFYLIGNTVLASLKVRNPLPVNSRSIDQKSGEI